MFRNVPACSGMFHVPGFIDAPRQRGLPKYIRLRESLLLMSGEMGKKLLAANSTDSDKTVRRADSTLCKHNFSLILSRTHT